MILSEHKHHDLDFLIVDRFMSDNLLRRVSTQTRAKIISSLYHILFTSVWHLSVNHYLRTLSAAT